VFGCQHYPRGCKIKANCCRQFFPCRWCHDAAISDHQINRFETQEMMCYYCTTIQEIGRVCSNKECGKTMAIYYCDICKFLDDSPNKSIYHCSLCGICRVGKPNQFFHCVTCGFCMDISLKDNHKCLENSIKSNCPICNEDLFSSTTPASLMKCGHSIHTNCMKKYKDRGNYSCPLCSKSLADLSEVWAEFDLMIEEQPMPEEFAQSKTFILCNDCEKKSEVPFHFLGHKCLFCGVYNTKIISHTGVPSPQQLRLLQRQREERHPQQ